MKLHLKKVLLCLAAVFEGTFVRAAHVIDALTMRDLELTAGVNKNHGGVCEALATPQTVAGKALLPEMMAHPLVDVGEIVGRQNVLKALVADPQLLVRLEDLLFNVAEREKVLATFDPATRSDSLDEMLNALFFSTHGLQRLNRSSFALNVRHALEYFTPVGIYLAEKVVLKFGTDRFLEKYSPTEPVGSIPHAATAASSPVSPASPTTPTTVPAAVVDEPCGHEHSRGGCSHGHGSACKDHSCVHSVTVKQDAPAWIKRTVSAVKFGHDAYHIVGIVYSLFALSARMKIVNALYHDIAALNALIFDCQRIVARVEEVPALKGMLSGGDLVKIKSFIDENYFNRTGSLSLVSPVGKTLVAYNAVQANLELVRKLVKSLASLDVYVAVARTVVDAQALPKTPFCFVEFVPYPKPFVWMKGGWHVLLKRDSVRANTFVAGAHDVPTKYVLSGPNGSGKSSFLRALGTNVVLAQVFGIAAAESFSLSLFHKIISFMTVVDDIVAGQSSFIARAARASMCLAYQEELAEGQSCLALLDDSVGQGTSVERGEKTAYEFIKTVGANHATVLVAATHYDRVKALGREPESGFVNIRMRVNCDLEGKARPEYLLDHGVSEASEVGVLLS